MIKALMVLGLLAPADTVEYRGDLGELEVRAPRVEHPGIRVDGRLDEAAWSRAAVLTGFTQSRPVEGIAASQETRVLVLYGPEALYFGITAYDEAPGSIRGTLTDRDSGVTDDDWIRILLDTFNDRSQAYAFYVNPRGVQADGLWMVGGGGGHGGGFGDPVDYNPDFLWESDARVTAEGWVAEIRIPYGTLRFREAAVQRWGLNVSRHVQRTEYFSDWAPITRNAANPLDLSGVLVGMEGLEARRLVELNPVATGKRTGTLREDGELVHTDFEPSFGLNARYGVSRNLMLDATLNPDFSQVEADEDQVSINERFALFFPEKRPFFLEGTEVFSTPQQLVYTRSIVDPIAGAKLTGKLGRFNLGYLGAVDESPVTFDEGSDEALFNLLRVRRDVGGGSTVGALYTDRTILDGSAYNRVAAADARLVLAGRYFLTTQVAGAWTLDDGGDPRFGPLFEVELERSGRSLAWDVGIEDIHPDFRARSGFIRRTGDARVGGQAKYTFRRPAGSFLEDFAPELQLEAYYDHDDLWSGRRYHEARAQLGLDVSLRGPNGFVVQAHSGYFAFDDEPFAGYERPLAGGLGYAPFATPAALEGLRGVSGFGRARPLPWLNLNLRGAYQEVPIFAEGTRGLETSLSPSASMRLRGGLSAQGSFTWARIEREDGSRFSLARIPRLKLQYQFTRALFVRGIVQYNLQDRDALRGDSGLPLRIDGGVSERLDDGEMRYDFLLSFEPSPGTILYAGWTRQLEGPNTYRYGQLTPVAEGLFVKVSYLFRL